MLSDYRKLSVPHGWSDTTIGEVAEVVGGGTPSTSNPEYWQGGIPWATPTDVTALEGRYISQTETTISEAGLKNSGASLLLPHSVLMTSRATIGACAINTIPIATNQGFASLIPRDGLSTEFLYYVLTARTDELEQLAAGSTFVELGRSHLRKLRLLCPPKGQQLKIAEILNAIDDAIEAMQAVTEQTRRLKAALLQDLLTNGLPGRHKKFKNARWFGRIPTDWGITQLGKLTTLVTSGSRGWSKYIADSGAFFVRSQNVGLGVILRDDVAYVDPPQDQEAERASIEPGDLLISITGEPGNVARADEGLGEAYVSQHVALVRLDNRTLSPWITLALCAPVGQAQFRAKMYGQTRPGLNLDNIHELKVPVPDEDEQAKCYELVQAIEERLTSSTRQLKQLEGCKTALSQGLLTGRIPVSTIGEEVA